MWGLVQFVVANAAVLLIANGIAGLVFPNAHPSRRLLATLAGYQVLVTMVTLVLGLGGWLHVFWIPALILALASVPFAKQAFFGKPAASSSNALTMSRDWMASPPFVCVLLALLVVWAIRHGMLGGTLTLDDRSHHAAQIAQWYQDGPHRLSLPHLSELPSGQCRAVHAVVHLALWQ